MADSFFEILLSVPREHVLMFVESVEPHVDTVSWTTGKEFENITLKGLSNITPDTKAINLAVQNTAAVLEISSPNIVVSCLASRDWVKDNLKNFSPITVERFFIRSVMFQNTVPYSKIELDIPASTAFGTGAHGSTKGCLIALNRIISVYGREKIKSALDMGCGSGILGIAIAKMLHIKIKAVDIDSEAIHVCRENARKNLVGAYVRTCLGGPKHRQVRDWKYDLIVANILTRPLIAMAKDIIFHLNPGGVIILSGLLSIDTNKVVLAYSRQNISLLSIISVDGWQTIILRKAKNSRYLS